MYYGDCIGNTLSKLWNRGKFKGLEIVGIGKFKGLEIVSEQHDELNEIIINLKYDEWDKNVL
jgi:hypothetical protein